MRGVKIFLKAEEIGKETEADETVKKDTSADIWTNASRFYYSIGEIKDSLMPTIVIYS